MAPVTRALIIACVLAYVAQLAFDPLLLRWLALWPLGTLFEPWQVASYAFLHGSVGHLFFNMFGLFMFGSELERVWGAKRYTLMYGASVVAAAVTQLVAAAYSGGQYPTVGASGGVFGLLLVYAVLFPRRRLMLLFPPIPMPAWLFVSLYALAELMLGLSGAQSGIAHFAHLGGMLGGAVALLAFRAQQAPR